MSNRPLATRRMFTQRHALTLYFVGIVIGGLLGSDATLFVMLVKGWWTP